MDRRGFFSKGVKGLVGKLLASPAGQGVDRSLQGLSNLLSPDFRDFTGSPYYEGPTLDRDDQELPRPPGALPDAGAFRKACTSCSDCVFACPYGVLFSFDGDSGPVLDPNVAACHLCEDYPCIAACETGALMPLAEGVLPGFGYAVLAPEKCLNHPDTRERRKAEGARRVLYCKECADACPVPGALVPDRGRMPVFTDHCTGCGLCVAACPPEPVALQIAYYAEEERSDEL